MQVVCRKTEGNAEFHCGVCGQGFVAFWDRQPAMERAAVRHEIQETLRRQHRRSASRDAHPQGSFLAPNFAPEWNSPTLSQALPGTVPAWEL